MSVYMELDIYFQMLDNDEMWYVTSEGNAFIMYDLPLLDA